MSASANEPGFVLIANPGSRRVELFQAALRALSLPPARVIAYADILARRLDLAQEIPADAFVKIDSPGRDFAVEKAILQWGADSPATSATTAHPYASASAEVIAEWPFRKGEILFPTQWFCGFCQLMSHIEQGLAHIRPRFRMTDPRETITMFDKPVCHDLLERCDIPVPRALHAVVSYDDLLARMASALMPRVFLKLAYGSSGSGAVAFQTSNGRQRATTTVELVHDGPTLRLFNSRRIRTYTDPVTIRTLIDALCQHRVHVEEWFPKAGVNGHTFDLRILGIANRVRHIVVRASKHPITNLHLLNDRGDLDAVRAKLQPAHWDALMNTCHRILALFPRTLTVAMDVAIRSDFRAHAVLELNAFGDLLPGVLHECQDVYTAQITACLAAQGAAA